MTAARSAESGSECSDRELGEGEREQEDLGEGQRCKEDFFEDSQGQDREEGTGGETKGTGQRNRHGKVVKKVVKRSPR